MYHRRHDDVDDEQAIVAILHSLRALHRKVDKIMADVTTVKGLVAALDTETNTLAAKQDVEIAKIADLQAQLAAGGTVSAADLQTIQDGLQGVSDRLTVLGSDPANPIPAA